MDDDLEAVNVVDGLIHKAQRGVAAKGETDLHAKLMAVVHDVGQRRADEVLGGQDQHIAAGGGDLLNEEAVALPGVEMALNGLVRDRADALDNLVAAHKLHILQIIHIGGVGVDVVHTGVSSRLDGAADAEGPQEAVALGLPHPVLLPRPQVLAGEDGQRLTDIHDGGRSKGVDAAADGVGRHGAAPQAVDHRLEKQRPRAGGALLDGRGDGVAQAPHQHVPGQIQIPHVVAQSVGTAVGVAQDEQKGEHLGQNSGTGRPLHAHAQRPHGQKV